MKETTALTSVSVAGCSQSPLLERPAIPLKRVTESRKRRKGRCHREAAKHITRIEIAEDDFRTSWFNSSSNVTQRDIRSLCDSDLEKSDDVKKLRLMPQDNFGNFNELGCSTSDRECSPQEDCYTPELNGKVRFGYSFIGTGKNLYATHLETDVQKHCQIIDKAQYQQILKVKQRLNEAGKYWKYEDLADMSNFVIPANTEILEWGHGKYLYLSPWQYGNLDISVIAEKSRGDVENTVRNLFRQILRGVAFCHAIGIIVRDLKPRKFAFVDQDRTILRLHDVQGLYVCKDIGNDMMVDHHGVPAYVAPEVLRRAPAEYEGKPADIWALGVLLYYLLFSRHPFSDSTLPRVFMRICRVSFCIPPGLCSISQAARILIYGMFKKEPSDRPTAEQLMNLRWFSETLNPSSTLYPSLRPCLNLISGGSGNRQSSPVSPTLNTIGRFLLSSTNRRHRTHRINEEDQVVPCFQRNGHQLDVHRNIPVDVTSRYVGR